MVGFLPFGAVLDLDLTGGGALLTVFLPAGRLLTALERFLVREVTIFYSVRPLLSFSSFISIFLTGVPMIEMKEENDKEASQSKKS